MLDDIFNFSQRVWMYNYDFKKSAEIFFNRTLAWS